MAESGFDFSFSCSLGACALTPLSLRKAAYRFVDAQPFVTAQLPAFRLGKPVAYLPVVQTVYSSDIRAFRF
jgi:hypothetical protein